MYFLFWYIKVLYLLAVCRSLPRTWRLCIWYLLYFFLTSSFVFCIDKFSPFHLQTHHLALAMCVQLVLRLVSVDIFRCESRLVAHTMAMLKGKHGSGGDYHVFSYALAVLSFSFPVLSWLSYYFFVSFLRLTVWC